MKKPEDGTPGSLERRVRPMGDIQSENGVGLLLGTVFPQNCQSATRRPMKVTEIVRDAVGCPKCLDLFLSAHISRLKACLRTVHDQWKSAGEPDLGECLVEQDIDGRDYLMFAYFKMAESYRPNDPSSATRPKGTENNQ